MLTMEEKERLYEENKKLIPYMLRKMGINSCSPETYEECYLTATEGFSVALANFDPTRSNCKFTSYACDCIKSILISRNIKMNRKKRINCETVHITDMVMKRFPNNENTESEVLYKELVETIMAIIKKRTENQKTMTELFFFDGYTYLEVSEVVGVSRQRVHQVIKEIREQIKRKIGDQFGRV